MASLHNADRAALGSDLVESLQDFEGTIPDAVLAHYLEQSGATSPDPTILKVVGLATQKFIFDVAKASLRYCQHRKGVGFKKKKSGEEVYTLTTDDLSAALFDQGVTVMKPAYYCGNAADLASSSS